MAVITQGYANQLTVIDRRSHDSESLEGDKASVLTRWAHLSREVKYQGMLWFPLSMLNSVNLLHRFEILYEIFSHVLSRASASDEKQSVK